VSVQRVTPSSCPFCVLFWYGYIRVWMLKPSSRPLVTSIRIFHPNKKSTNSFLGGAISGGGFEYGILAEGPGACNDNKFYGTCVEPPDS